MKSVKLPQPSKRSEVSLARSSAAEYLTFVAASGQGGVEAVYIDESIWLTQKMMGILYDVNVRTVNEHLKKIFADSELQEDSVIRKFRITAADGKNYNTLHYKLPAIIAVGYKVNSERAVQFRKWATGIIEQFTIKAYVMDDERIKAGGSVLTEQYFEEQLQRIREIRLSERKFYQKITDIYATAIDYDVTAQATKRFFATVQNKLHWAIHGQTAAELIYHRADAGKERMGLTTWKDAPQGKIQKFDVVVAKNYLTEHEMAQLSRLVNAYLDIAEDMALRKTPMTMQDWETRLNRFIEATDREVLQDADKVTAEIAKAHAESEFEKYRIVQDRLFESDFDRMVRQIGMEPDPEGAMNSDRPVDPGVRDDIQTRLSAIETEHGVRVLYACESGSRGWGFASPDSDYDVRFIYVHSLPWYLLVSAQRDVIEVPISDELDINGWELRKALGLLKKGNATLIEWLDSPVVYRAETDFLHAMREAARQTHQAERSFHHYVHMARKNYREYLRGDTVRLKKYLYVLRPLLATLWIEQGRGVAPMRFQDLVDAIVTDPALREAIAQLLAIKRAALESEYGQPLPIINAFIDDELTRLESVLPPLPRDTDFSILDRLLLDTVLQPEARRRPEC